MVEIQELLILFVVVSVVLDLIITGILGLIRKEISARSKFMQILFIPLGLIGGIVGYFYSKVDDEKDKGNAAVSSSVASIATGLFIAIVFGFYYLDTYGVLDYSVIKILVPAIMGLVIFGIPVGIVFGVAKSKSG